MLAKYLDKSNRVEVTKSELSKMKLRWQAPEVIFYNKETEKSVFYAKSDVWSFGEAYFG